MIEYIIYIFAVVLMACVTALDSPSAAPEVILTLALCWIVLMLAIANYIKRSEIAPVQKDEETKEGEGHGKKNGGKKTEETNTG